MALPIRPNNPNIPIPNTSFSAPLNAYVNGPYFPVVMGTGIDVGTGTKVADLNNAGVLEFSGATGDINLLAGTGISVVETTSGADSDFTITNTGVTSLVAGSNITLSASSGAVTISAASGPGGTVTSVGTGVGLTGGPITSSGTISLDVSGVAPGSYTYPSITVDAYGRVTVAANGTAPVTAITGTAPVQVTGSAPTLNVAVAASSTTAPGVVQLVDALNSSSTTQALTAAQGKVLQDQITALSVASNITLAGTLDASTGNLTTVTAEGTTAGFSIGAPLPAAAAGNDNYFVIASVAAASYTPPGGSATQVHVGDWFLSDAASWQFLDVGDSSGGTVTSVATTAALTGGPITTSGTLDLAVTGVTAGTVNYPASLTVDACGRITALGAASNPVTESDFQAKGDLIAGFGVNSYGVVGVGSNGQMLTANSACASGMEWVTPAAGAGSATPTVEGLVFGCTDTTNFNYGLGDGIFGALTTGTLNIAIGSSALASADTGTSNTAAGIGALYSTTSGTQNVALGQQALFSNVIGGLNVAIGSNALQNTTGDANTALGNFAGNLVTTGCSNILIGNQAGGAGAGALDTGNNNVVIGNCVSPASNSADCQLAIGVNTVCWLTGDSTGAIKPGAGVIDCAGSCGTAGQVLMSNGSNAICWGSAAAPSAATPLVQGIVFANTSATSGTSVSLGYDTSPGGTQNLWLGWSAGKSAAGGSYNVVAGYTAGCSLTTAIGNTTLGWGTMRDIQNGVDNVAIGGAALQGIGSGLSPICCNIAIGTNALFNATGCENVAIGWGTGTGITTGCNNVLLGNMVQAASGTGSCQLAIGFDGGQYWLTGDSTKAIKPGAGVIDCSGSCGTAGQVLMSNGANAICWGSVAAPSAATPTVRGTVFATTESLTDNLNTGLGQNALKAVTTGYGNTALGWSSGCALTTGSANTFVGENIFVTGTSSFGNTAVGDSAGNTATGSCNVFLGLQSGYRATGNCNTFIGYNAVCGAGVSGIQNVAIGYGVSLPVAAGNCQLVLGFASGQNWLTGDSTKAIKPGAGIIDCAGSCGTAGQVLSSNGSNAIEWITAGGGGGSSATPTAEGTLFGYSDGATNFNVGLGYDALNTTATGIANLSLGYSSGCAITSGVGNVLAGAAAGCALTTGSYNVGSGFQALSGVTTGQGNIAIGNLSGNAITTEDYNVVIGGNPGPTGVNNNILLADGQGTLRMQVNESGAMSPNGIDYGTAGQVLTSNGSGTNWTWETPSGGSSPVVTYNQLVNVTASTAASVLGWEGERGTSSSYLQSGNVSAMLFITANSGTNGTTPVAWAQILVSSLFGTGLSQVIASDTTGGTFSIASVIYPAYTDTTIQFTSATTESPMLFNISLNWFGGFRYAPTLYGTAAT